MSIDDEDNTRPDRSPRVGRVSVGAREHPDLTAEAALSQATSTNSLIDLLQAEKDLMIRTFGPPWVEQPVTLCRSNGLSAARSMEGAHTGVRDIRQLQHRGAGLGGRSGESGVSVSTCLPRLFSRAKIQAHSPGSYPDRFDCFGQGWPRHQSDAGHWDDDDSSALRQDSWQDWHPFAARNRFMGHTQWDGEKRGST
jgi:hypothetical protein